MIAHVRGRLPLIAGSAGAAGVGLGVYLYNRLCPKTYTPPNGKTHTFTPLTGRSAFQVKACNGKVSQHILLTEDEAEIKLRGNSTSTKVQRQGNPVVRWDTAQVTSASEDRLSVDLVNRNQVASLGRGYENGKSFWERWAEIAEDAFFMDAQLSRDDGGGDLMLFSVFDGHGGAGIAELLRKVLHPTLAWGVWGPPRGWTGGITDSIRRTITALDDDILRLPLTLLRNQLEDPERSDQLPHPSPALTYLATLDRPGLCLSTLVIDVAMDRLFVANLGDCRVVAGWFDHETGGWRCDVLSDKGDQQAANPVEVEMMRALHPDDDGQLVIQLLDKPRLLGVNMLTRSIGNAQHKREEEGKESMAKAFDRPQYTPQTCASPPYMRNNADVVVRELHPDSGEQLKFVILASDGVWDWISSEQATVLVAAHLSDPHRGTTPKTRLIEENPLMLGTVPRPKPGKLRPEDGQGSWALQDDNAAVHLLRNALGRGDAEWGRKLVSADHLHDDMTAIVVIFDEPDSIPDSTHP